MPEVEKHTQLHRDMGALQAQVKTLFENQKEQADVLREVQKSNMNIERIAVNMEAIQKNIVEMREDIDQIEGKPAKHWDALLGSIIGAIVTSIIAYAMMRMGMR